MLSGRLSRMSLRGELLIEDSKGWMLIYRARSVFERALEVDPRSQDVWVS